MFAGTTRNVTSASSSAVAPAPYVDPRFQRYNPTAVALNQVPMFTNPDGLVVETTKRRRRRRPSVVVTKKRRRTASRGGSAATTARPDDDTDDESSGGSSSSSSDDDNGRFNLLDDGRNLRRNAGSRDVVAEGQEGSGPRDGSGVDSFERAGVPFQELVRTEGPVSDEEGDAGTVYNPRTGTLTREVETFKSKTEGKIRYGRTRALDDHPALRPQIVLIVGNTGAGKTTAALNWIDEILSQVDLKRLGAVMYYTGSPGDKLLRKLNPEVVRVYGPQQTEHLFSDMRALTAAAEEHTEETLPLNILVLDDIANSKDLSPRDAKGSEVGNWLVGHRHLGLQIILMSQKFNSLPTFARENRGQVITFPGRLGNDTETIIKDSPLPQDALSRVVKNMADDEHAFLWINHFKRTAHAGFNKLVLS